MLDLNTNEIKKNRAGLHTCTTYSHGTNAIHFPNAFLLYSSFSEADLMLIQQQQQQQQQQQHSLSIPSKLG